MISNGLRKELGIPIEETGNVIFKIANGKKMPAIGKARIEIETENGIVIPTTVQITDIPKKMLIIGMKTLVENGITINLKKKKLIMEIDGEKLEIPIYYTKNKLEEEDSTSESETEEEYDEYEEMEESEMYTTYEELYLTEEEEFKANLKTGEINETQKQELEEILQEYRRLCVMSNTPLGQTDIITHRINTGDHTPIQQKYYRVDEKKKKIIKDEIEKMEKAGVIRKSYGPWASPVVIVRKKDGSNRFCVDYRKINSVTITDAHPLPRIDDLLERFRTAKWFTSMDLASGYWQIKMEEKDMEKTAFTCPYGLYEFTVMPFGLKKRTPNISTINESRVKRIFR